MMLSSSKETVFHLFYEITNVLLKIKVDVTHTAVLKLGSCLIQQLEDSEDEYYISDYVK